MPRAEVTHPFNYRHGSEVKAYAKGSQDLPDEVLAHAIKNGFVEAPKPAKPKAAPAAE